jgi:integrin beta 8
LIGPQGETGQPGVNGKSAFEIAQDNGFTGTVSEWLTSLQGQNGSNGNDGQNGVTPHIDPTSKHWMIGETDTNIIAEGQNGTNGQNGSDGITPHIDPTTGNWFIGETNTGVQA